jgi:putative membrane protein
MNNRHGFAACLAALLGTTAWSMEQGPATPPDATGAGAPSSLAHTTEPSGMAVGTSINHDTVIQTTTQFLQQSAQDDATEEEASQYALANSNSLDIKAFARRILAARSKANDEQRDLAAKLGITMPTYPTSSQSHALEQLRTDSGARLDAAYAVFMADAHTRALARFRRAAQSSRIDPAVRQFAQNSLPAMQDGLKQANRLVASHATRNRATG